MARVPIADQNVIADYLDAETQHLNTLIASKSHLRDLLAERRQATTWLGVSGSLTNPVCSALAPSGIPWTSELPVGWRAARLNLIARLGSGHTPSRDHPEWRQDCTIPWITTGEVAQVRDDRIEYVDSTRESISELGMANSSAELHPAETVVLSRTASAGFSAIMRSEMATSQDFATWCCGPLLRPRFLLLCLRAMRSDLLDRLAQGSTHKTIYMPDIASIKIPLPSIVEQDKIVEKVWIDLKRIERLDAQLQRQIDLLVERRQALITAAVTGNSTSLEPRRSADILTRAKISRRPQ